MKKILLLVVCLITFYNVQAQNSSYANRMQHIFGNIDKNKVTTGYLKEFGVRFANIEACNGSLSTDNFVTKSEWQAVYSSLYSMRVGQAAVNMASPQTVKNQIDNQQNNTEDILIAVQHYNYQQYKSNAHTNGDVIISNERIYDVAGRNPYNIKTLFAITSLKHQIQGNTFTFQLPSGLVYSNYNTSISQIQIDFDNGQGYQTISQNQKKSVTYTNGGEKEIKVKFTYSSGNTFSSHSKIWLDFVTPNQNILKRFNGFGGDILWNNNPITGNVYNGSSATGRVTIELAPGHTQLTKPLIVIEGFDPEDSFNYFSLINSLGAGGLNIEVDLTTGLTLNEAIEDEDYDLVFVDFVNSTDFIQRNAYMVEQVIREVNALKVASGSTEKNVVLGMSMGGLVGRYALRHMEIEGETHDTKLYISHDTPHQGANVPLAAQALVRHLVGEEISLPVFFSLFNVNILDLEDNVDGLSDGLALLQSPAAQQMLVYQLQGTGDGVSVNNNTLCSSFLNEYKSMGYPQQNGIRNIAIANGTECGNPLDFNPYDPIVNANVEVDLPFFLTNIALAIVNGVSINPLKFISSLLSTNTDLKAQFTLRALTSLQSKQIYRGRIYIKKTILFLVTVHEPLIDEETVNSSSSMLALDNANGGIYDIDNFAELPAEFEQYVQQRRFNFIPAYSSLDVGSGNETINPNDLIKKYNPTSPPPAPKDIPFDNFFTNPITSEGHIQFTLNNGNWLVSELADNPQIESCSFACNTTGIAGTNRICLTSPYSYSYSVPAGADSYQWSVFTGGRVTVNSATNTNTINISRIANKSGWITLNVRINSVRCGVTDMVLSKQVYVGTPIVESVTVANGAAIQHLSPALTPDGCEVPLRINFTPNGNDITDIEWEKITTDVQWSRDFLDYDDNFVYLYPNCNKRFEFRVRAYSDCGGWTEWQNLEYNITECSRNCPPPFNGIVSDNFRLYPVPANDVLNIAIVQNPTWNFLTLSPNNPNNGNGFSDSFTNGNGNSNLPPDYSRIRLNITIHNNMGVLVYSTMTTGIPAQLNLSSLPAGYYVINIQYNGQIETHNITIN